MVSNNAQAEFFRNYALIWVDANHKLNSSDINCSLDRLKCLFDEIDIADDENKCIEKLENVKPTKSFVISSGAIGQTLVPIIHDMDHLESIFIFCRDKSFHDKWACKWKKIQGVYTSTHHILNDLKLTIRQHHQNNTTVVFLPDSVDSLNLEKLDPSFMYTSLLKDTFISMKYSSEDVIEFAKVLRKELKDKTDELENIHRFKEEFVAFFNEENENQIRSKATETPKLAIQWYTRECFLYKILNKALYQFKSEMIVDMGFYIAKLHKEIQELYTQQRITWKDGPFTVYRGQGLPKDQLSRLQCPGSMIGFNNFISSSTTKSVAQHFAETRATELNQVGILFVIKIDFNSTSVPFAKVEQDSCEKYEEEIMFSMNSVFRVESIKLSNEQANVHEVFLVQTKDNDKDLVNLKQSMQKQYQGIPEDRLGKILITMGCYTKSEEIYSKLLKKDSNKRNAIFYDQLGSIKQHQGFYADAKRYHELAIEIKLKSPTKNDKSLAVSYGGLGTVNESMGDYAKALSYYKYSIEILENCPENEALLASFYNNVGAVYMKLKDYSKAKDYYERCLTIREAILPKNHPDLAIVYNNIGGVHKAMGEYAKALSSYKESLRIKKIVFPTNHPSLSIVYNNIGLIYYNIDQYDEALEYYENALMIKKATLSKNHSSFGTTYKNMGMVHQKMKAYERALEYYEKALLIWKNSLPADHADILNVREAIDYIKKACIR